MPDEQSYEYSVWRKARSQPISAADAARYTLTSTGPSKAVVDTTGHGRHLFTTLKVLQHFLSDKVSCFLVLFVKLLFFGKVSKEISFCLFVCLCSEE